MKFAFSGLHFASDMGQGSGALVLEFWRVSGQGRIEQRRGWDREYSICLMSDCEMHGIFGPETCHRVVMTVLPEHFCIYIGIVGICSELASIMFK
jgi:hypothetical protein